MNGGLETLAYARSFIKTPYIWGGKNPQVGYDCSGFVCEAMRKYGLVLLHEILDAKELFERFSKAPYGTFSTTFNPLVAKEGDLLFFGPSIQAIDHVAMVADVYSMIESAGGDHTTTSPELGLTMVGSGVRERAIKSRGDFLAVCYVVYPG